MNQEVYSVILHHIRDATGRNRPEKMEDEPFVSPSQQCSSTPVGFGRGFRSKEQCENTGGSCIISWTVFSWFLSVLSNEISTKGKGLVCCYRHHKECDERAEKFFSKYGFQECFPHFHSRLQKSIFAQGTYFEGNVV